MFDRLKRVLTMFHSPGDSVVGVDIGSAYIKVVQLRRKGGKAVLETYGSLALGPYAKTEIGRATHLPPEVLAEALRDLLREAHITSQKAACSIPFTSSLVTIMDLRVHDPKQLASLVSLEARKYVPVPISEVNLDWWIIPEELGQSTKEENHLAGSEPSEPVGATQGEVGEHTEGAPPLDTATVNSFALGLPTAKTMKILIAAIHNDALSRFQGVALQSGLEASFFEVELFSAIRVLFPQDLLPHAVLDLGAGETKLYIIDRGIVRLSHVISHGGQDITLSLSRGLGISVTDAEKMKRSVGLQGSGEEVAVTTGILNLIFGETNRALEGFERKTGKKIDKVMLSGGGANLLGLEELAKQTLSVPAERAHPFKQVEAPAFLEELLQGVGPEFTVAIGIAFRKLQEGS